MTSRFPSVCSYEMAVEPVAGGAYCVGFAVGGGRVVRENVAVGLPERSETSGTKNEMSGA